MLDFTELWIGDQIFVRSKGSNASWEGMKGEGKALVKIKGQKFLVDLDDIGSPKIEDDPVLVKLPEDSSTQLQFEGTQIDLHIEVLNPKLIGQASQIILNHQLKKCKAFIDYAIQNYIKQILIIHGVGEGVLKMEILHLLQSYHEVQFSFEKNQGGATEVWFK